MPFATAGYSLSQTRQRRISTGMAVPRGWFRTMLRRPGAMGEREARTQGAFISPIWTRPRTPHRAAQRGRAAQAFVLIRPPKLEAMDFRRIHELPPYVFATVDQLKRELRREGRDVIDLGFGNPDIPSPAVAVDKLAEAAHRPVN